MSQAKRPKVTQGQLQELYGKGEEDCLSACIELGLCTNACKAICQVAGELKSGKLVPGSANQAELNHTQAEA